MITPRNKNKVDELIKGAVKFQTVEEAWFWFIQAQEARNDGARFVAGASVVRPCDPIDILQCIDRLYRKRRLLMDHLLVLRHYGRRLMPPDQYHPKEKRAYVLWTEGLSIIQDVLEGKNIVERQVLPFSKIFERV